MTFVNDLMAAPAVMHVISAVVAIALAVTSQTAAQEPQAQELQRRAVARVTSYREHLRKTGDKAARADDLVRAVRELEEAHRTFLAAGNAGEAAACRVETANALQ